MSNEEKSAIFAVLGDLEGNSFEIERVRDMLQLYDEWMENEMESFSSGRSEMLFLFPMRYKMLHSLMDAIQIRLKATLAEMDKNLKAGYDISRRDREATAG